MGDLKRHFRKYNCPNIGNKNGREIWNAINRINDEFNAQELYEIKEKRRSNYKIIKPNINSSILVKRE